MDLTETDVAHSSIIVFRTALLMRVPSGTIILPLAFKTSFAVNLPKILFSNVSPKSDFSNFESKVSK